MERNKPLNMLNIVTLITPLNKKVHLYFATTHQCRSVLPFSPPVGGIPVSVTMGFTLSFPFLALKHKDNLHSKAILLLHAYNQYHGICKISTKLDALI